MEKRYGCGEDVHLRSFQISSVRKNATIHQNSIDMDTSSCRALRITGEIFQKSNARSLKHVRKLKGMMLETAETDESFAKLLYAECWLNKIL